MPCQHSSGIPFVARRIAALAALLGAAARGGASRPGEPPRAAFIVNDSPTPCQIDADFGGRKPISCRIVDATRTDAEIDFTETLPPHSFMLVEFN